MLKCCRSNYLPWLSIRRPVVHNTHLESDRLSTLLRQSLYPVIETLSVASSFVNTLRWTSGFFYAIGKLVLTQLCISKLDVGRLFKLLCVLDSNFFTVAEEGLKFRLLEYT